jgi:hypothetical protein
MASADVTPAKAPPSLPAAVLDALLGQAHGAKLPGWGQFGWNLLRGLALPTIAVGDQSAKARPKSPHAQGAGNASSNAQPVIRIGFDNAPDARISTRASGTAFRIEANVGRKVFAAGPRTGKKGSNDTPNSPQAAPPGGHVLSSGGNTASVQADIAKLPDYIMSILAKGGINWQVTPQSVGQYPPYAHSNSLYMNQQVPGWMSAAQIPITYSQLPEVYDPADKAVIIAEHPIMQEGSYDVDVHETGHAFDDVMGNLSQTPEFIAAYNADKAHLGAYYNQPDAQGDAEHKGTTRSRQEAFAESFARYYADDPTFGDDPQPALSTPHLYAYFEKLDAKLEPHPSPGYTRPPPVDTSLSGSPGYHKVSGAKD